MIFRNKNLYTLAILSVKNMIAISSLIKILSIRVKEVDRKYLKCLGKLYLFIFISMR